MFTQADLIYSYTRQQAIEDGVLIDVSEKAKEAGFKWPVAVTSRLWAEVIEADEIAKRHGESDTGRLWDLLHMLRVNIAAIRNDTDKIIYRVLATERGHKKMREIKADVCSGDEGEPVITIMMPDED